MPHNKSLRCTAYALLNIFHTENKDKRSNRGGDKNKNDNRNDIQKSSNSISPEFLANSLYRCKYKADTLNPQPGDTFIMRTQKSKLVLTLLHGELRLLPAEQMSSRERAAGQWDCVDVDGWLGFFSAKSDTCFGRREMPEWAERPWLVSVSTQDSVWSRFVTGEPQPGGGYVLWAECKDVLYPVVSGIGENGEDILLVDQRKEGGLVWEFLSIDP